MTKPDFNIARSREDKNVNFFYNKYEKIEELENIGEGKKYFVRTYGCQMNEHDSENIKAILEDLKYTSTDNYEEADIIVLNTCAIRENVHDKVFGMLGRIKHLKETRPNVIAVLCGCMAQEEVVIEKVMTQNKFLDLVFGTHNISNFPRLLLEVLNTKEQVIEVHSFSDEIIEAIPIKRDSKLKAWVNIMYGCDNFCTYCIVPYTRGKQRSRKKEDILKEIEELIKNGYKEITLLGQNVNSYGNELENNDYKFANLLEDIAKTGIPRIRFVTSHPWDFSDDMIEVIKQYENIMPYIHLPMQAGSDKILKLMGRKYTKEHYLNLIEKIKTIKNVSISTDIIVGFPNETDEDFLETLEVVDHVQFDFAYTFIYSKREGTPAAKMEDTVDMKTKEERLQTLNKKVNSYARSANEKLVGKTLKILVEDESRKKEGTLYGYSEEMKLVNFIGDKNLIGEIVEVEITKAKSFNLEGILSQQK